MTTLTVKLVLRAFSPECLVCLWIVKRPSSRFLLQVWRAKIQLWLACQNVNYRNSVSCFMRPVPKPRWMDSQDKATASLCNSCNCSFGVSFEKESVVPQWWSSPVLALHRFEFTPLCTRILVPCRNKSCFNNKNWCLSKTPVLSTGMGWKLASRDVSCWLCTTKMARACPKTYLRICRDCALLRTRTPLHCDYFQLVLFRSYVVMRD